MPCLLHVCTAAGSPGKHHSLDNALLCCGAVMCLFAYIFGVCKTFRYGCHMAAIWLSPVLPLCQGFSASTKPWHGRRMWC